MSFTHLAPLAVAAGLAGLAGLLYLLQRLRVRHRQVEVVKEDLVLQVQRVSGHWFLLSAQRAQGRSSSR